MIEHERPRFWHGMMPKPLEYLTPREAQAALLVGDGLNNAEVGRQLGLTHKSVQILMTTVYEKLECHQKGKSTRIVLVKWIQDQPQWWKDDIRAQIKKGVM